jgi:hypothetical protein
MQGIVLFFNILNLAGGWGANDVRRGHVNPGDLFAFLNMNSQAFYIAMICMCEEFPFHLAKYGTNFHATLYENSDLRKIPSVLLSNFV